MVEVNQIVCVPLYAHKDDRRVYDPAPDYFLGSFVAVVVHVFDDGDANLRFPNGCIVRFHPEDWTKAP